MTIDLFVPRKPRSAERIPDLTDIVHLAHAYRHAIERTNHPSSRHSTVWSYKINWMDSCERAERSHSPLTRDALAQQVMQHSVQRGFILQFEEQRHYVQQLRSQLDIQRLVLSALLSSFYTNSPSGSDQSGLWESLQSQLATLNSPTPVLVPPTLEGFISTHELGEPISKVRSLVADILGTEARVREMLKTPRESRDFGIVLEISFSHESLDRSAWKQLLTRYSVEVPEYAQQYLTLLRLPY
jgi:hypothetical protein